jgi:hypothetical protein
MSPPANHDEITQALQDWRQGDVILDSDLTFLHVASAAAPLTEAAAQAAGEEAPADASDLIAVEGRVSGFVVVTQTCDILRNCAKRHYVELSPVVEVSAEELEAIRRLKRPAFAYIPGLADRRLVADLDRVMTVEKAVLTPLQHVRGVETQEQVEQFADQLARKRRRFAFPDDFGDAMSALAERLKKRAGKVSDEGKHVGALVEIRVRAHPSWDAEQINLTFWLIRESDPEPEKWAEFVAAWKALFDQAGRFTVDDLLVVSLDDLTAREYLSSAKLEYDDLSAR